MARSGSKLPLMVLVSVFVVLGGLVGASFLIFGDLLLGASTDDDARSRRTARGFDTEGRARNAAASASRAGTRRGAGDGTGSNTDDLDGSGDGTTGRDGTGRSGGVSVRVNPFDRSGRTGSSGSGGSASSNRPADNRPQASPYQSSGTTWRLEDIEGANRLEKPETPENQQWTVIVSDGEGPVAVTVQLFAPVTPMEMRVDGLYGGGMPLPTTSIPTNSAGRLVLEMDEVLPLASDPAAPVVGIFIDDANHEPRLVLAPVIAGEETTVVLVKAHFVQIEVRHQVTSHSLADAEVELWRFDPNDARDEPSDVLMLRTDGTGKISSRIRTGRHYAFRVRKAGFGTTPIQRFECHQRDVVYRIALYPGNFLSGVVLGDGGTPIGGAKVTCQLQGNAGWGSDEAVTDEWGGFTVTRVPHSDFTSHVWVTIVAPGYATLVTQALTNSENAQFQLSRDGLITGIVQAPPNLPLRNPIKILATQKLYGNKDHTFEPFPANPDGTFALSGLVAGEVTLVAKNEFGHESQPRKIVYSPGVEQPDIVLQLEPPSEIFVRVTNQTTGAGVPGIQIGINTWRGLTDSNGTVHFQEILPGKVNVAIIADLNANQSLMIAGDGETYFVPAAVAVDAKAGEVAEVEFVLVVWTPPVTETPVVVTFAGDPTVSAPGSAKITTAFDGTTTQVATTPVPIAQGVGTLELTIRSDATTTVEFTHPDFRPVTIPAAQLQAAAEGEGALYVTLDRLASLSLQVVDRSDVQIFDVDIQLRRGNQQLARAKTDGAGRVFFTNIEAGPVRLIAFKHGYRRAIFELELPVIAVFPPIANDDGSGLSVVDLGSGTSSAPPDVRLILSNAGDFHVSVVTANYAPAVGAHLYVSRIHEPGAPLQIFDLGQLDAQGGKVVRLHWDVWYQVWVVSATEIAYAHFYNDPNSPQYQLALVMEPRGAISGTVVDANNAGVKDVEVRLVPDSGPLAGSENYFPAFSRNNGTWEIPVPASCTYKAVLPKHPNTPPIEQLPPGQQGVTIVRE